MWARRAKHPELRVRCIAARAHAPALSRAHSRFLRPSVAVHAGALGYPVPMTGTLRKRSAMGAAALAAGLVVGLSADSWSSGTGEGGARRQPAEFQFVRLAYNRYPGMAGFGQLERWLTDWPEAEQFLMGGVRRLTRIDNALEGLNMSIMDERLFDYPFAYAVEVGGWYLSDAEAERLREYLLRGGFLMVDDFHGSTEWAIFVEGMRKVFPDRPIVDIPADDPIFRVVHEIDDHPQIPGIQYFYTGRPYERDGFTPHWRGIYDDDGRLMVVINFNMDLGDAWEHADIPEYALQYTTRAYQYAINYIVYAMTH